MKKFIILIALLASPLLALARTDVGVSITIGDPNYYGALQLGGYPPPALLYSSPVIIQPAPGIVYPPVYLRVPPGHYKRWSYYCRYYGYCNRPVYFVTDNWYRNTYVPRYYYQHPDRRPGWGWGRDNNRRYYDRDDRRGGDRGDKHDGRGHWDRDKGDRGDQGRGHGRQH